MGAPRLDRLDKNLIIGGNFDFWQRFDIATTPTSTITGLLNTGGQYLADRFFYDGGSNGSGAITASRVAGPGGIHQNALRLQVTSNQAVVPAGATAAFNHRIEGYYWEEAYRANVPFVVKFKARSFQTGFFSMQLANTDYTQTIQKKVEFTQSNVWTDFAFVIPANQVGTWNITNNIGLNIRFSLVCGANLQVSSENVWSPTLGIRGIPGQLNFLSSTSNFIDFAGFQLSIGDAIPASFSRAGRTYIDELQLVQRYYERNYPLAGGLTNAHIVVHAGVTAVSNSCYAATHSFKVRKRGTPNHVVYDTNGNAGVVTFVDQGGATFVGQSINSSATSDTSIWVRAFGTGLSGIHFHYAVDAEM
jgi:hypothetical protein